MKKNLGQLDRLLRIALGAILLSLAIVTAQPWGYLGLIPLFTGIAGRCPAYRLIGLSTLCKSCNTTKGTSI